MAIGRRTSEGLGAWKWDSKLGRSVLEDRVYTSGSGWAPEQRNIENSKFRALADLPNLQLGWIAYLKGVGLDAKLLPVGQNYGDRPTDEHKEGLRLIIKTDASLLTVFAAIDHIASPTISAWADSCRQC